MSLMKRLEASYDSSLSSYAKRLANGRQPPPPEFVMSQPWLAFLDYRDTNAMLVANSVYVVRWSVK